MSIAESIVTVQAPSAIAIEADRSGEQQPSTFSLKQVLGSLQMVLATRRAARNADHAVWYTIARGM